MIFTGSDLHSADRQKKNPFKTGYELRVACHGRSSSECENVRE
jgi:hypothetical protein